MPAFPAIVSAVSSCQPAGTRRVALDRDVRGVGTQWIDEEVVPVDDRQVRRGVRRLPIAVAEALGGGEVVERHFHGGGTGRHFDLDEKHLQRIAVPREGLAARGDGEAGHLLDRPAGRVLALHPLRVGEGERAGRGGNHETGVEDAARRVRRVDRQLDGARLGPGASRRGSQDQQAAVNVRRSRARRLGIGFLSFGGRGGRNRSRSASLA